MRVKLRYALPSAQMALAVGLLWWAALWGEAAMRLHQFGGTSPAFTLCISLSAPVALIRALWFRYLSIFGDHLALVLAVGVLWYWVALNVESWRRDHHVWMFRWVPLRLVADLLLMVLGLFMGITWVPEARRTLFWSGLWMPLVLGSLLAWSLGLIFFFGRDLINCVRSRTRAQ